MHDRFRHAVWDVRRWHLAQVDFKITLFLVRATILMLAAAGIYRSVETVAYVAVIVLAMLCAYGLLFTAGIFAITPVLLWLKPPKGSPVGRIFEAEWWSMLIVGFFLVTSLLDVPSRASGMSRCAHFDPLCRARLLSQESLSLLLSL